MLKNLIALCGASLIATSAFAAGDPATPAAPGAKSVQLSKVILDTETSELTARVKGGTLCVFPSNVKIPKEKKTQNYERFDNLFTTGMKARGFTVLSTSSEMFSDGDSNKADYLIGVTLRPTVMNLCSSVNGEKGDIALNAEWQIFDRAAGKVVETVSTSGTGTQPKFAVNGQTQMLNQAFLANLTALVEKGVVGKYTGQQPPSD